jgi:hypothetical protein
MVSPLIAYRSFAMFRLILPATILIAGPMNAQTTACPQPGTVLRCFEVFACIGDNGETLHGKIDGLNVAGTLDSGATCTGMRTLSSKYMAGEITFACTDGTQGSVFYDAQKIGDVFGYGDSQTNDGRSMRTWVAENLGFALRHQLGVAGVDTLCPGARIEAD